MDHAHSRLESRTEPLYDRVSGSNAGENLRWLFTQIDLQAQVFDNPKPIELIQSIISVSNTLDNDIVLDFFAGSGTTGHAVMAQNAKDGGNRRYILVQLPEPLDPEKKEQKTAAEYCDKLGKPRTIAELTKERLRRAAKKIKEEHPDWNGDTGFRVFKLDSSNIKAWNPRTNDLEADLVDHMDHILPDRTEADLLYELLLKLGLDLCVPIEEKTLVGKTVHAIGGGVLMACLAEKITTDEVEALGQGIVTWHKALAPAGDTTCVFRDSAFENDVAKTNLAAILEQAGIVNVRSI
nr:DNA methyltransferase [Mariprofundus ferrooxydans]